MSKSYIHSMEDIIKDLPWQVELTIELLTVYWCMPGIQEDEDSDESKPNMLPVKFRLNVCSPACRIWGMAYLSHIIDAVARLDSEDSLKELYIIKEISEFTSNTLEQTFPGEKSPFSLLLPQVQEGMIELIRKVLNKPKSNSILFESGEPYVVYITQKEFANCINAWTIKKSELSELEEENENG